MPRGAHWRRLLLALCGTTLAVAVASGIGVWRMTLHEQGGSTVTQSRVVTEPAATPAATRAIDRPALIAVSASVPAEDVFGALQQLDAFLASSGVGPLATLTMPAGAAASSAELGRAMQQMNAFLAPYGELPVTAALLFPTSSTRAMAGQLPGSLDQGTLRSDGRSWSVVE